ncbi:hypothetical protein SteCoe_23315 [Stentor coeruleus]|uniref:Uncharacterized protein n=1 Tax=Stentor coeruleus TaxID=5963 RepID=A0A1R2BKB5_9CILI|nr:hypothetical protein SteCoe_23315 [Stentor coeruleus]
MDKPRFSPERDYPQAMMLQKQIYRKEEKYLGLCLPSEKERFEKFIREYNNKFSGIVQTLRRDEVSKRSGMGIQNTYRSQFLHQGSGSRDKKYRLENSQLPKITNRTWDNVNSKSLTDGVKKEKSFVLLKGGLKNFTQRRNIFY